jgi:hypothetical protein
LSFGVNPGTLARWRHRATETLLVRVRNRASECLDPRLAADCLEVMLAGDDPELRRRVVDVLAAGMRSAGGS